MSFQTCMFFREIQKEMFVRMFQLLFTIKKIYTSNLALCERQNFFIIPVLSVMPLIHAYYATECDSASLNKCNDCVFGVGK